MLNITTQNTGNDYTIILDGRLNTNTAPDADRVFTEVAGKADKVTLDCKDLVFLTSAGLRSIKKLRISMKDKNSGVTVINVRPEIMEIFEFTGFTAMLDIV